MLVCDFRSAFCTRDRGCRAHPAFPAPSLRDNETQTSGVSRRENADVYLLFEIRIEMSLRHCERSEAIHFTKQRKSGLLRCARNDVDRLNRMPRHHPSLTHIAHQRHEATWCSG